MIVTAGLETVGIRMPRLALARHFLESCETPVAAPSANISGRPSPTNWEAVAEDLDGRIDCILQGEAAEIGLESTVVDCTSAVPAVLRSGSISLEHLQFVVPETEMSNERAASAARSPGLLHRHYSPRAIVLIVQNDSRVSGGPDAAYIGLSRPAVEFAKVCLCSDVAGYARSLFEFFRECDRGAVKTIFCERVEETGLGVALMDRIKRAAAR